MKLGNDCRISVYQLLVPNANDPQSVTTARYSYAYSFGPDPDQDWLVRYDYEPEKINDDDHPYSVSHVHINAENDVYAEFIKETTGKTRPLSRLHLPTRRISLEDFVDHLIIEFDVPILGGKTKTRVDEVLNEGRQNFEQNRSR